MPNDAEKNNYFISITRTTYKNDGGTNNSDCQTDLFSYYCTLKVSVG